MPTAVVFQMRKPGNDVFVVSVEADVTIESFYKIG
jgi:hypothetical protein